MDSRYAVLEQIRERIKNSTDCEARVADAVLGNPHAAIDKSIAHLAAEARVSEPTVVRFCRSLGFDGFRDFKLRLAQSLASGVSFVHREVQPGCDTSTYIRQVSNASVAVLSKLVNQLDEHQVEDAVCTLANARKIEFWGFGASGAVASDAHHKFLRLGIPCTAYSDAHLQCMSASISGSDDVIVAISHTGRTKELIDNVRTARNSGVIVIGITASQSPLAGECSQVLGVEVEEDTNVFPPMTSRLAHLLVLDILVVGVALRRGQQARERLQRVKEALRQKRLVGVEDEQAETR